MSLREWKMAPKKEYNPTKIRSIRGSLLSASGYGSKVLDLVNHLLLILLDYQCKCQANKTT